MYNMITIMNSKEIHFDVEYVGQDPSFKEIPIGYINKTVCGCGLTSVALENGEDAIIAVPYISLLMNKVSQYPNSRFAGEILGVYGETAKEDIDEYVAVCRAKKMPVKVVVCYDSLHKVEHLLNDCKLIIDESDQILKNIKLKAETTERDMDAYSYLLMKAEEYKDKVSFISATPVPVEYLPKWMQELPQVTMTFANSKQIIPIKMYRQNPVDALKSEIIIPIKKNGSVVIGGREIRKVIVFLNSVRGIGKVIKECLLSRDEVSIICGENLKNDCNIKEYRRLENFSNLPQYTFLTSTGFQGIDLSDDEAISVVVSNSSCDYQMINLQTDLKQAISRQRNKQNPNYDRFIYIYNQANFNQSESELMQMIEDSSKQVRDNCELLNELVNSNDERFSSTLNSFKNCPLFKTYSTFDGNLYKINELVFNADKYFLQETRRQYEKGFNITENFTSVSPIDIPKPKKKNPYSYKSLLEKYRKSIHNSEIEFTEEEKVCENYQLIHQYYQMFGNLEANSSYAKKRIEAWGDDYKIILMEVRHTLKENKTYFWTKELKPMIKNIYSQHGVNRTPKRGDLYEFGIKFRMKKKNGYDYVIIDSI